MIYESFYEFFSKGNFEVILFLGFYLEINLLDMI
jgi:hypothetical protein